MAVRPAGVLYDEVPYPGHPFAQTHPDRLASLGRLYGLASAAPSGCRLLELGCGDGGNLLPMASTLPGAQFVGIDISSHAIARPRVTAMARLQVQEGPMVANLRHEATTLDEPARVLVTLLDGTRDRAALLDDVAAAMEGTASRSELAVWLEGALTELARSALLLPVQEMPRA